MYLTFTCYLCFPPNRRCLWQFPCADWCYYPFIHNGRTSLYGSPSIIKAIKSRRMRWAGHEARMSEIRNAYRILVGRSEDKRPLWRPRRRWEDNTRMDLREIEWEVVDWMHLT